MITYDGDRYEIAPDSAEIADRQQCLNGGADRVALATEIYISPGNVPNGSGERVRRPEPSWQNDDFGSNFRIPDSMSCEVIFSPQVPPKQVQHCTYSGCSETSQQERKCTWESRLDTKMSVSSATRGPLQAAETGPKCPNAF